MWISVQGKEETPGVYSKGVEGTVGWKSLTINDLKKISDKITKIISGGKYQNELFQTRTGADPH